MTIEAVGMPETFMNCIDAACFGARVVLIGVSKRNLDNFFFTIIQKKRAEHLRLAQRDEKGLCGAD